jgi:hypothetical protein
MLVLRRDAREVRNLCPLAHKNKSMRRGHDKFKTAFLAGSNA